MGPLILPKMMIIPFAAMTVARVLDKGPRVDSFGQYSILSILGPPARCPSLPFFGWEGNPLLK